MKVLLGSCTQHNKEEFVDTPLYSSMLTDIHCEWWSDKHGFFYGTSTDAVIRINNKEPIYKHYNTVLEMAREELYDAVVLCHDDIDIQDSNWKDKVKRGLEEYDIIGLAGAKAIHMRKPVLWHLMSEPESWSGAVAHPHSEGGTFVTAFGPAPRRCLLLDGLFLAINVKKLTDDIVFDEQNPAPFHFYDLDFCLTGNKHKLKLGTWPIWCLHESPGLENATPDFDTGQEWFLKKWSEG